MQQWRKLIYQINYRLIPVLTVAIAWVLIYKLNDVVFQVLEVSSLITLIFLPAGIRLISILLLHYNAVIGLFIGALITNIHPEISLENIFIISLISAVNPYIAYISSNALLNVKPTLQALTSKHLLLMSFIYALFNAVSHNIYFYFSAITDEFLMNTLMMFTGDLIGTILVLYLFSVLYKLFRKHVLKQDVTKPY